RLAQQFDGTGGVLLGRSAGPFATWSCASINRLREGVAMRYRNCTLHRRDFVRAIGTAARYNSTSRDVGKGGQRARIFSGSWDWRDCGYVIFGRVGKAKRHAWTEQAMNNRK